jgi:uncharacterized membrane protein (DUF485 family)
MVVIKAVADYTSIIKYSKIHDFISMQKQRWERIFELSVIGLVIFIGMVSLLYSWIDSIFGGNVNVYVLTAVGILVSFGIVYAITWFDRG